MLEGQGVGKSQAGSFLGKLCKDHGDGIVLEAVRTAAVKRPADVSTYLVGLCQHLAGQRRHLNRQETLEANNRDVAQRAAERIRQREMEREGVQ